MGLSIDKAISHLDTYSSTMGSGQTTQAQHEESKRVAIETMRKYQKMQADYENRLKADMVAMLENLRLKADETQGHSYNSDFWEGFYTYDDIIKHEINALKGENT